MHTTWYQKEINRCLHTLSKWSNQKKKWTIMNMMYFLLIEKEMPKTLWVEATKWINHVINRSLTKNIKEMTLLEKS